MLAVLLLLVNNGFTVDQNFLLSVISLVLIPLKYSFLQLLRILTHSFRCFLYFSHLNKYPTPFIHRVSRDICRACASKQTPFIHRVSRDICRACASKQTPFIHRVSRDICRACASKQTPFIHRVSRDICRACASK